MPSAKQAAWIVGLSLLTILGLEHYRNKSGAGGSAAKIMGR